LDLDETLIHSCLVRDNPDVILTYQGSGLESPRVRPLLFLLLTFFSQATPNQIETISKGVFDNIKPTLRDYHLYRISFDLRKNNHKLY